MHKMYFDTGVVPENHRNKDGKLIEIEGQEWRNGTLQIPYYLEEAPKPNYRLKFLIGEREFQNYYLSENEVAIKVVGGNMISDFAIFQVLEEK